MIQESEIQERLLQLGDGSLSLDDFERWIGPASVGMHRASSPAAIRLAAKIHHLLDDYDRGDIAAAQLRAELVHLLDGSFVFVSNEGPIMKPVAASSHLVSLTTEWVLPV
jgi:hypothetical protein